MLTPTGQNPDEVVTVLKALRNRIFGLPTLAVGSTASRIQITNQIDFCVDGTVYRKAATDNISVGSLTALTADQTCRLRVEIDSAGTVTVVQGKIVTGARGTGPTPIRSASKATLGTIDVAGAFTFGTTTFAAETFTNGDPDLAPDAASPKDVGLEA